MLFKPQVITIKITLQRFTISSFGFNYKRSSSLFLECHVILIPEWLEQNKMHTIINQMNTLTQFFFLMGTTVIRTMSITGWKVTKQTCYLKFTTPIAKHLNQSLRTIVDQISFNKHLLFCNLPGLSSPDFAGWSWRISGLLVTMPDPRGKKSLEYYINSGRWCQYSSSKHRLILDSYYQRLHSPSNKVF